MSGQLKDIVAIIDMDGYSVNRKFLCKELGFLQLEMRWPSLSFLT